MGSLDKNVLASILNSHNAALEDFPIFIETGTHLGTTSARMSSLFREVHTIEISDLYYEESKKSLNRLQNVKTYLGDCVDLLPSILSSCVGNTVFWLDGHWSGGTTGRGKDDCPVLDECKIINNYLSQTCSKSIIVIDDYRLFGEIKEHNWKNITVNNIRSIFPIEKIRTDMINNKVDCYSICVSYEK